MMTTAMSSLLHICSRRLTSSEAVILNCHPVTRLGRSNVSREQNAAEGTNVYSTPNSNWPVIDSFKGGQVIEIDTIMNAYHWVSARTLCSWSEQRSCNKD